MKDEIEQSKGENSVSGEVDVDIVALTNYGKIKMNDKDFEMAVAISESLAIALPGPYGTAISAALPLVKLFLGGTDNSVSKQDLDEAVERIKEYVQKLQEDSDKHRWISKITQTLDWINGRCEALEGKEDAEEEQILQRMEESLTQMVAPTGENIFSVIYEMSTSSFAKKTEHFSMYSLGVSTGLLAHKIYVQLLAELASLSERKALFECDGCSEERCKTVCRLNKLYKTKYRTAVSDYVAIVEKWRNNVQESIQQNKTKVTGKIGAVEKYQKLVYDGTTNPVTGDLIKVYKTFYKFSYKVKASDFVHDTLGDLMAAENVVMMKSSKFSSKEKAEKGRDEAVKAVEGLLNDFYDHYTSLTKTWGEKAEEWKACSSLEG